MRKLHWSLLKRVYKLRGRFDVYARLDRRWLLDNHNWVDQQLIIRRPYEVEQLARCRKFVQEHQLQVFLDIGANFGLYSVLLANEPGLTEAHAFEPLPRNIHQLGANLYLNDLDQRVQVHAYALSDRSGKVDLYIDPESTGVSTMQPVGPRSTSGVYQTTLQVEARVFDEQWSFSGIRALVKIDVEGAELRVLAGMSNFLASNKAVLQVETTQQTCTGVCDLMEKAGYKTLGNVGPDYYFGNI